MKIKNTPVKKAFCPSPSTRSVMAVSWITEPNAPPAPVISNIGAASLIPTPIHSVNVFSLYSGSSKNAKNTPTSKATVGEPRNKNTSKKVPDHSAKVITDPNPIKIIGTRIGANDLKVDGNEQNSYKIVT